MRTWMVDEASEFLWRGVRHGDLARGVEIAREKVRLGW